MAVFLFQPGRPGNVRVHALPLHQHALPPEAAESGKLFQSRASGAADAKSAQRSVVANVSNSYAKHIKRVITKLTIVEKL